MLKIQKYEGLVAAPFTPMDKNGDIKYDVIKPYYEFLEKNEIAGAFINGSTGEGVSLTQKEKQLQAEKWAECHKPADENRLAEFCTRIGESVPQIPVYFYHIPALTGVNIPMIRFMEEISAMLPNFAGIKYTHEDFMDFMSCLNYQDGAYDLLWGKDECLLPALSLGCKGGVGSTYNYAAPLYQSLIKAFNEGDISKARHLQQLSINMIDLLDKYGGIATGKAFMKYIGFDCGSFRSPVQNMADDLCDDFANDVRNLKIDHLFSRR